MQYADLMRPEEDWRELGDPSERRKIQNRIAQRAYRRNMRERASKIEELKSQLRTYEEMHLPVTQEEDHPHHQRSSVPALQQTEKGAEGWCPSQQGMPPMAPSNQPCPGPFTNGSQLGRGQQQGRPATVQQQSTNSPRPAGQQRMEWPLPNNGDLNFGAPLTPAQNFSMDGMAKIDTAFDLSSSDPFASSSSEEFPFDSPKLDSESQRLTSLLHMAVAGNHVDTIKVLLQDRRVAIDEKDTDGYTPLQRAVMQGRSEAVRLLLEHDAKGVVAGGAGALSTNFWGSSI